MAKTLIGVVASNKGDKSIVVAVQSSKTHPLYRKQYMVTKRFMAHDDKNEARVGDKVIITETRPLSARKRHILTTIVERPLISQEESVEVITAVEDTEKPKDTKAKAKEEDSPAKTLVKIK